MFTPAHIDDAADVLESIAIRREVSTAAVIRTYLVLDHLAHTTLDPSLPDATACLHRYLAGRIEQADRSLFIDLALFLRVSYVWFEKVGKNTYRDEGERI